MYRGLNGWKHRKAALKVPDPASTSYIICDKIVLWGLFNALSPAKRYDLKVMSNPVPNEKSNFLVLRNWHAAMDKSLW